MPVVPEIPMAHRSYSEVTRQRTLEGFRAATSGSGEKKLFSLLHPPAEHRGVFESREDISDPAAPWECVGNGTATHSFQNTRSVFHKSLHTLINSRRG